MLTIFAKNQSLAVANDKLLENKFPTSISNLHSSKFAVQLQEKIYSELSFYLDDLNNDQAKLMIIRL